MLSSLQDEVRREALKQRAEQSIHQEEPGWEEDEGGLDGGGGILWAALCRCQQSVLEKVAAPPCSHQFSSWLSLIQNCCAVSCCCTC